MISDLAAFVHQMDYMQVILFVGLLVLLFTMFRAQDHHPSFNLIDMIVGTDGKASLTKVAQFGSFVISSWGFIHLVAFDKLTDWYFTAYMVSWTGSQVLTYWISKKGPPDPSTSTVSVTSSGSPPPKVKVGEE